MTPSLDASDVVAIQHLLARCAHAFDRGDGSAYAECFVADGEFHVGGIRRARGHAELAALVASRPPDEQLRHMITSISIGANARHGTATSTSYGLVWVITPGAGRTVLSMGVYDDDLTFDGESWRFARRRYRADD